MDGITEGIRPIRIGNGSLNGSSTFRTSVQHITLPVIERGPRSELLDDASRASCERFRRRARRDGGRADNRYSATPTLAGDKGLNGRQMHGSPAT